MLEELDRQLYINLGYVFLESQNLRQQKKNDSTPINLPVCLGTSEKNGKTVPQGCGKRWKNHDSMSPCGIVG
jgi:hypothetical protein